MLQKNFFEFKNMFQVKLLQKSVTFEKNVFFIICHFYNL